RRPNAMRASSRSRPRPPQESGTRSDDARHGPKSNGGGIPPPDDKNDVDFKALFTQAIGAGASDIHLQAGRKAVLRVHGSLVRVGSAPVASAELHAQITQMLPPHLKGQLSAEAAKGLDFSYTDGAAGRFR